MGFYELWGKMVPFAGWSMPIQYSDSIMESTKHCREHGSLFDVSHMCGLSLKGPDSVKFLEGLVVGDIAGIPNGSGSLSVFTNEKGGIIDDTVITKVADDEIYLVVNAGCREKDLAPPKQAPFSLQGEGRQGGHDSARRQRPSSPPGTRCCGDPGAPGGPGPLQVLFLQFCPKLTLQASPATSLALGTPGEDGFEISVPNDQILKLAKKLLENPRVRLCGLGARDSLRLEAGLCLYGNDLDESKTPVEAGLTWTIGKRRRDACDFLGGEIIKKQLADGVNIRRVGLLSTGAPARQHSEILNADGKHVGEVTSGAFSPCLKKNIAMGYVDKSVAKAGTPLKVVVRGKQNEATVSKMPFVPNTYYKG
eukprot:jgi/Botrbrau1/4139/Bobra.0192s0012.2